MAYVITGYHRNGYYFPGALLCGTWARNVPSELVAAQIERAEASGWEQLRATEEFF